MFPAPFPFARSSLSRPVNREQSGRLRIVDKTTTKTRLLGVMTKTKSKKTREEKLVEAKLRRRKKYEEIKNDPEKYAIQKEKERLRYLKRKEQKQIKSAADMTPREKRLQRKKWKENSKRYAEKKKTNKTIQQLLIDGIPPSSDSEHGADIVVQQDPLEGTSRNTQKIIDKDCKICQKRNSFIRKLRYEHKKQIGKLKQEKEKIEKERDYFKRMLAKTIKINEIRQAQSGQVTTVEKVDRLVETIDSNKREEVKKKLLFGELICRNLSEGFSSLEKKEKRVFSDIVIRNRDNFKKHKVLGKANNFTVRAKSQSQHPTHVKLEIKQQIEEFFEDDSNTKLSPGKNEFITRNGVRKQKRYLNNTLTNLYKKFLTIQNSNTGYSTFCKYRPFWVMHPKESDRNTCACKVHVNIDLLVKSLNKNKIIKEANGTALLQSLCCDVYNESCLNRTCEFCRRKLINFEEFNNKGKIHYYEWCTKRENYVTQGKEKVKIVNTKKKVTDYPKNIIEKLQKLLNSYFKHCTNIVVQYKHIKTLKATLSTMEAVVHIDFSENYSIQFNEEIQSFHFGGSRTQITLHTAVIYIIDQETGILKPFSACSISECNKHDARAVWAHLLPLLGYIQEIAPLIDTIHFVSDSPSSQYRNRYMFYVISQLHQDFPELKSITWNYLEAGHGKGAPDGVGAVLKRTADQIVRMGKDIGSLEEFWTYVGSKVKNIKLLSVSEHDVIEKVIPSEIQTFRGTMSVHQVLWSSNSPMTFRKLSCFFCENGEICSHGYHLGFLDLPGPILGNYTIQIEDDILDLNATGSFFKDIANDCVQPRSIQEQAKHPKSLSCLDINVKQNIPFSSSNVNPNKAITVLSDIKLHWSNKAFINKKPKTKTELNTTEYQKDFESFISGDRLETVNPKTKIRRPVKTTMKNFFDDSSDEDLLQSKTDCKQEKDIYEDKRDIIIQAKENINYYCSDSSNDNIF